MPETCDICDAVVIEDEMMEEDGIFRCASCHDNFLNLRDQYPEQF